MTINEQFIISKICKTYEQLHLKSSEGNCCIAHLTKEHRSRSWYCGIQGKTATCETHIPYGYWLESQLFQFQSSFLLLYLEKQWRMSQDLRPLHPHGRLKRNSWLSVSTRPSANPSDSCCGHLKNEQVDFLALSQPKLVLWNCGFQINLKSWIKLLLPHFIKLIILV